MLTGLLNKLNFPACQFILMPKVLPAPGSQITTISQLPNNPWEMSLGDVCVSSGEGGGGYLVPLPLSASV